MFKKKNRFHTLSHIVLIGVTIAAVLPFWLLIAASFSDEGYVIANGYSLWPKQWSLTAYRYLINQWHIFGKGYLITILVTIAGVILSLAVTSLLAYMLAQRSLPGGRVLMFLVIFTMLFNGGLVATYMNYTRIFSIKNTYAAYIFPNLLTGAFYLIMVKNYFMNNIPDELKEAAKIDGASEYGIFLKVVLPLSKPIMATLALMVGVAYWNDWQNGVYYIDKSSMWGIQNILNGINNSAQYMNTIAGGTGADIPTVTVRMAAAVIGILPILVIYPFFQDYFVKGITMGAVKG